QQEPFDIERPQAGCQVDARAASPGRPGKSSVRNSRHGIDVRGADQSYHLLPAHDRTEKPRSPTSIKHQQARHLTIERIRIDPDLKPLQGDWGFSRRAFGRAGFMVKS